MKSVAIALIVLMLLISGCVQVSVNESDDLVKDQINAASDTDNMLPQENTLQENSFWYFIHDEKTKYSKRIELIFDLLVKNSEKYKDHDDPYYTFIKYKEGFDEEKNIDNSWKEIKVNLR